MERIKIIVAGLIIAIGSQPTGVLAQSVTRPSGPIGNIGDWFPRSSMPAEAVVRREVGVVVVKVSLDADGKLTACRIVESSGYSLLDTAACDRIRKVGRFKPALDDKGAGVASTFTLPRLRYALEDEHFSAVLVDDTRKIYNSTVQVDIDRSGNVEACRSLNTDMPDKRACTEFTAGNPAPPAFRAQGGSRVTISNTIVVDQKDER